VISFEIQIAMLILGTQNKKTVITPEEISYGDYLAECFLDADKRRKTRIFLDSSA
jgi:hypothetical protein